MYLFDFDLQPHGFQQHGLTCVIIYLTLFRMLHWKDHWPNSAYLWSNLRLVIGQKVVVEFRTVEHARKRLGRCGVGLGRVAVVAGYWWNPGASDCFWRLFTSAIDWRLLWETLVRQKVGLDCVLSGRRLGCGRAMKVSQRASQDVSLSCRVRVCFYLYDIMYIWHTQQATSGDRQSATCDTEHKCIFTWLRSCMR